MPYRSSATYLIQSAAATTLGLVTILVTILSNTTSALADEPGLTPTIRAAALLGGDFPPSNGTSGGAGGGARVGVSVRQLYAGITGIYSSRGSDATMSFPSTESTRESWTLGGELGYDVSLPVPILVRPYLGLGDFAYRTGTRTDGGPTTTRTVHRFYAAPGVLVAFTGLAPFEVGLDARYTMPVRVERDSADWFAFGLYGTAGVAF